MNNTHTPVASYDADLLRMLALDFEIFEYEDRLKVLGLEDNYDEDLDDETRNTPSALPAQAILLDIYTVVPPTVFPSVYEPLKVHIQTPQPPQPQPPQPTNIDRFAKEQAVRREGEAKEGSKSEYVRCGSYIFGGKYYCRKRLCPVCSNHRHRCMRDNLISHIQNRPHEAIYSITMTMTPSSEELNKRIKQMTYMLCRLRRRKLWQSIAGGVYFIDVTYKPIAQEWHPHLHLVIEASSISFPDIRHLWLKMGGGICRLSKLEDTPDDIFTFSKYHTKPAHLKDDKNETFITTPSLLEEYTTSVKGKQLFRPFGSWSKTLKLLDRHRN